MAAEAAVNLWGPLALWGWGVRVMVGKQGLVCVGGLELKKWMADSPRQSEPALGDKPNRRGPRL